MSEPTVTDPAWCRGYDAGYFIGLTVGAGRERAAIVAWLEDAKRGDLSGRYLAAFVERGEHRGEHLLAGVVEVDLTGAVVYDWSAGYDDDDWIIRGEQ